MKKGSARRRAEPSRRDERARGRFEGQPNLDPERIVVLDETAAATDMTRRHGRARRGERCRLAVPHGHDKTTTVTAALRGSGPFAVDLMDGATNGARFLADVTDVLVPALMFREAAGAKLLHLPVYSFDFDSIKGHSCRSEIGWGPLRIPSPS